MKILFLIRSLNRGGAERQLVELSKGLHKKGHSVVVVTFYSGGAIEKELNDAGIFVKTLQKRDRWDVLFFSARLIKRLRKENADVIHGYLPVANIIVGVLKPFFPEARIVWGVRASNVDLTQYDWLSRFLFKIECFVSRFADLVIINSNAGREYHAEHGYPEAKIVVIPNGIDTDCFNPNAILRDKIRASWQLTKNEKLIGLIARIDPIKGHPTFIRAASIVVKKRKDVKFVCVGDGSDNYKRDLFRLAIDRGLEQQLIWAGERQDMNAVYNALDIAAQSSYSEGFPNVVGEAMSCGVPCIVTDVGDSARIVGDTGMVVPPKNEIALANGILEMLSRLEEDSENVSKRARMRICEQFGIVSMVTCTEKVLMRIK